ncbi:MAG: DegV family protein [Candidatus Paceibacterota bacterium]|jgi:DegV family protein with EDD domain
MLISIITGQSASLPREITEQYSLTMIPFVVDWEAEKKNLDPKSIFEKMAEAEAAAADLPKTSHPAPWLFKKFFQEKLKSSESVLFISISSGLSATFQAASVGREMLDPAEKEKTFIFDCRNVSIGEGLIAIKAAELAAQGKSIKELIEGLEKFRSKVSLVACFKDLKWIERGGRISKILASALSQAKKIGISPVFGVKNGEVTAVNFNFGKDISALTIFNICEKENRGKKVRIAIAHAQNEEAAKELERMIKEKMPSAKIEFISVLDNIIGIHAGPGALLCAWHELDS